MTYIEACRVAEEAANWIRKHDVERVKRVADLEKARGIIAGALNTDPITIEPDVTPAPFVHPDDEPTVLVVVEEAAPQANGAWQ